MVQPHQTPHYGSCEGKSPAGKIWLEALCDAEKKPVNTREISYILETRGSIMPHFKVRRYNIGIWDKQDPRDVVASSAKEAAEKACGERLIAAGTLGKLRAEVWQVGYPQKKETFYSI
jgi:hypothetical protein